MARAARLAPAANSEASCRCEAGVLADDGRDHAHHDLEAADSASFVFIRILRVILRVSDFIAWQGRVGVVIGWFPNGHTVLFRPTASRL
jgi:hypothetical protein